MTFAFPNLIWLLALAPLLIWFFVKAWRRRQELIARFIPNRLVNDLTVGVSKRRQKSKMALSVIAVILIVLALARPQWGYEWDEATQKGLDILVAIDASRSMLATDVRPNRLERAKLAALDLMAMAQTDRIGLIAFAGTSFLQCPLTLDDNAFRQSVRALNPDIMPQGGTALADTISVALDAFAEEKDNHKILVLFTDGEDHQEYVLEMGEEAAQEELRIFTIGVGSPNGDLIPLGEENGQPVYLKDRQGKVVKSKLNEALLQQLAGMARGFYLNLNAPGAIETLYAQGLAPLPKGEINSRLVRRYFERFYWPLLVAIVLLLIEMFLPDHRRSRRRRPSSGQATVVALWLFLIGALSADATPAEAMKKYRKGDYAGALEEYEKLKEKLPNDHRLLFNAGAAAYKAGDLEKARRNFSAATATEDEQLQRNVWQNLGNTFYRIGQDDQSPETKLSNWKTALKMYELALKSRPEWKDAQHNRNFVRKMVKVLEEQMQKEQSSDPNEDREGDEDEQDKNKDPQQQDQNEKNPSDQKRDSDHNNPQNQQDQEGRQNDEREGGDQKKGDQQSKSDEDEKKDDQKQQPQPGEEDEKKKEEQQPQSKPGEKNDSDPGDQEKKTASQPIPLRLSRQQAEQLLDAAKARERTLIFNPGRREKGKNQKNPILKTW